MKRFHSPGSPEVSIDCEDMSSLTRPESPSDDPYYKCEVETCGKEFPKLTQYRNHQREHDNDKPNRCDECPASFNVEYNLTLHKATHNTDALECPDCEKTFSRLASLKSHLMLHEKDENLICSECGDEFSLQVELDIHLDEHRNDSDTFTCETCGQEFRKMYLLKQHKKKEHTVARSRYATTRKRRVPDRSGFEHVCTHCGKSFQKPSQLVRHVRVHTGERPFKCNQCDKSFNQNGSLQTHITTMHNGEKQYICDHCEAPFSQKGNLKTHIIKVHEINVTMEDSFPCEICPCVFQKKHVLKIHMDKMHNDEVPSMVGYKASFGAKKKRSKAKKRKKEKDADMPGTELNDVSDVIQQLLELSTNSLDTDEAQQQIQRIALEANLTSDIMHQALEKSGLLGEQQEADYGDTFVPRLAHSIIELLQAKQKPLVRAPKKTSRLNDCKYCGKSFKKPSDLIRHERIHTNEKPFKCNECSRSFTVKSTMTAHMKTHIGVKEFECDVCHKMFATHGSLKVHLRLHTGAKPYECPHCDKKFRTSGHRKTHITSHFKDPNQRKTKHYSRKPTLDLLPDVTLKEPIRITDKGLIQPPVESGSVRNESSIDRPYLCQYCAKGFKKASHLKEHIQSHTGEKVFKCLQCEKCFETSALLKAHSRTHTGDKTYKCPICEGLFTSRDSFKQHVKTHREIYPFMCPHCPETFKTLLSCKEHMKTHTELDLEGLASKEPILVTDTGLIQPPAEKRARHIQIVGSGLEQGEGSDRPYTCQYCAKGFKKSSHLKQHIRSHTGERPYKCSQCEKYFVSLGVLESHRKTHTGVKAHKCQICDVSFTTNGSLTRHMSTHSEARPFLCPYCPGTFKTLENCKKHMKIHKRELGMQALKQQEEGDSITLPIEKQLATQSIEARQKSIAEQIEQAQNALLELQQ